MCGETIGLGPFGLLEDWASTADIRAEFDFLAAALNVRTEGQREFFVNVLDSLSVMEVTLRRWELTGTQTYGVAKLAGAWKGQPAAYAAIPRRIGSHSPNAYEFKEELGRGELFLDRDALFLLLQCQFPVGTDEQAQRDLRAWTLLTALWHASQGHQTQDRLLASFCAALRQAAYEVADPVWRRALMPLGHAAVSFATLTKRIETLTGDDLRRSGRSESEIRILLRIAAYASNETKPFPDTPKQVPELAALYGVLQSSVFPSDTEQVLDAGKWLTEAAPVSIRGTESRNDDESDSEDLVSVVVDASDSPTRQALHLESTRFQLGAQARFLPWDWDLPVPPERVAIAELAARTLESPPDHATRLIAALTTVALDSALGLEQAMLVPLAPAASSFEYDWVIDLPRGVMRRSPLRRLGHWTPPRSTAELLRPTADALEIPIGPLALDALRVAAAQSPASRLLGQLWGRQGSVRSAFLNWAKGHKGTERLQGAMLQRVTGQVLFEATHDHVLSRLVSATAKSALPASTLYCAFRTSDLEQWHADIVPVTTAREDVNAGGSLLEPLGDDLLSERFERANRITRERGNEGSWMAFHNRVALHWDAALRAATGVRPVQGLWSTLGQFDWQHGFVYVDDKSSPLADSGRLVPLPLELVAQFEALYVKRHLPWIRAMLGLAAAEADPDATPLLFAIHGSPSGRQILPISNEDRRRFEIEAPLPLNVFRHRLRTQLHREPTVDPELIDAVLGHGDGATLTHGDYSMRVWEQDAAKLRPVLAAIYERLRIHPPPEWQDFELLKNLQPRPRTVDSWIKDLPDRRYSDSKHQRAWFDAMRTIKRFLENESVRDIDADAAMTADVSPGGPPVQVKRSRPLDPILKKLSRLGSAQLDSLSRALLAHESGMPSSMGALRYEFFLSLTDAAWDRLGQNIALGTRYGVRQIEASPFSASAPGSLTLFAKTSAALDDLFAAVKARSELSLGDALCLAIFDLCLTSRICNRQLLNGVVRDPDSWRVIRLGDTFFLEWGAGRNLTAEPALSVQRFPISLRAAWLLASKIRHSTRHMTSWLGKQPFVPLIAAHLPSPETLRDRDGNLSIDAVLDGCCRITDQVNAIEMPGTLAGFLAGRVWSTSLAWGEWLHAKTGRWCDTSSLLAAAPAADRSPSKLPPGRFATLDEEIDQIALSKATRMRDARDIDGSASAADRIKAAHALVGAVRARIGALKEAAGITRHRSQEANRLAELIHERRGQVSSAIYSLCLWAIDMLLRPGRSRKLATSSVDRYFGALSPRVLKVAYDAEIEAMDDEEIETLYADIIAAGETASIRSDSYDALRSFHSFIRVAAGLPDIDWSGLAVRNGPTLASSGYIDEQSYLRIFERLGSDNSCRGVRPWQLQVILLLGYRFGLRGAEVFGLNRSDLVTTLDPVHVRVKRNRRPHQANYTSLKTTCSRRVVPLLFELSVQERHAIALLENSFVSAGRTPHIYPLFALADYPEQPIPMADVRSHLNLVIKKMTGQRSLSFHDLRHTFASKIWAVTQAPFIAWRDMADVTHTKRNKILTVLLGPGSGAVSRRSPWALARVMGHSHARRALQSYVHGLGDAAHALVSVHRSTAQLGLEPTDVACISLNDLPEIEPVLGLPSETEPRAAKPSAALHALLFLSQGRPVQEVAAYTDLPAHRIDELARASSYLFAALLAAPRSGLLKHALPRRLEREPKPSDALHDTSGRRGTRKHQQKLPPPSRSVRMSNTGLLTFLHASSYERLRAGLSSLSDKQLAHLRTVEPIRLAEWRAMVADRLEVSMWMEHHFEIFGLVLRTFTKDRPERIELLGPVPRRQATRAGTGVSDPLERLAITTGWLPDADPRSSPLPGREPLCHALKQAASLPTVRLDDDGVVIERRAVLKLAPKEDGVVFNRAEMLVSALCINLFANWQA